MSADRMNLPMALGIAWLGVGLAGGTPASALPLAPPALPGAGVVLVQAEPGAAGGAPFEELNDALAAARAKLEELTGAAEIATIAGDLRRQLEDARADNAALAKDLEEAQAAAEGARADVGRARADVAAREKALAELAQKDEALIEATERQAAELARLRQELDQARGRAEQAGGARQQAEARVGEMRQIVDSALEEAARLGEDLKAAQAEVAAARAARAETEQQRAALLSQREALQAEADRARQQLDTVKAEFARLSAQNAAMEEEIGQLRAAASSATDAARDNLLAVEDKIKLLQEALSDARPDGGAAADAAAGDLPAPAAGPISSAAAATPPPPGAAAGRADPPRQVAAVPPREPAGPGERPRPVTIAAATVNLPMETRVQVQGLLADLKAHADEQGLVLTVPGRLMFALNSEEIESTAHDVLARAAELINIYEGRRVVITGHTDAMGEASYNRELSQRRASLVKQFFIDHFGLEGGRLETDGLGEEAPIASNATVAGRQANRRVEIRILN